MATDRVYKNIEAVLQTNFIWATQIEQLIGVVKKAAQIESQKAPQKSTPEVNSRIHPMCLYTLLLGFLAGILFFNVPPKVLALFFLKRFI